MGLEPRFKKEDIARQLRGGHRQIEAGIIAIFQRVGELFVTYAKDALNINPSAFPKGDYQDRTKNLRSSIGYFVLKDGEIIGQKLEGNSIATAAAKRVLGSIPNKTGYQLVGVAGMEYASHLESKGYNVITSQQDVALVDLHNLLRKYKELMSKKGVDVGFSADNLITSMMR